MFRLIARGLLAAWRQSQSAPPSVDPTGTSAKRGFFVIGRGIGRIFAYPRHGTPPSGPPVVTLNPSNVTVTASDALRIYKATTSGWQAVAMHHEVTFSAGSAAYAEGDALTQGAVSAVVARVVLESGTWGASTAAGRLIIEEPTGGVFAAGAAAGDGVCTLAGASAEIVLSPGGRVQVDRFNFGGSVASMRLYGCDGVNREFEFDGDVLVPLNTGMGNVRASCVRVHKNHLFFAYTSSLQHSSIGDPYQYSVVTGAGELATGGTITNLISVSGSENRSALMVMCADSLSVLYGNSSADWNMVPLSEVRGALPRSAQDIGGIVALDNAGVVRYPNTQAFGNFLWERVSLKVDPLTKNKEAEDSVLVAPAAKYRIFFTDGTAVCGFPTARTLPNGGSQVNYDWTVIDYGIHVAVAVHGEIGGLARTFYGDTDGWVYEADVGRSFAGETIAYALMLTPLNQKSPMVLKTYRDMQFEVSAQSACTISTAGEFDESGTLSEMQALPQYGAAFRWGISSWGTSYWGVPENSLNMAPLEGSGTSVALSISGDSASELPHTITAVTLRYLPRRMKR